MVQYLNPVQCILALEMFTLTAVYPNWSVIELRVS